MQNVYEDFELKLNRVYDEMVRFGLKPNKELFEEVVAFLHFLDGRYGPIEETKQRDFSRAWSKLIADIASQFEQRIEDMQDSKFSLSDFSPLKDKVLMASNKYLREVSSNNTT